MPKVTVLMAVYNGERYLKEAIESILGQTFQDFEFLIINDGSTDSTRELVLSYNDSRIRLVDNEHNLGQTRSLNRGLELAEGQFIARQDGDDISEPERLARQVSFLETNPEVALVGTWYKEIDPQGNLMGERELPCDCTEIRWCLLFFCAFVHSTVLLRKSAVLEQVGFYNEAFDYAQDYELWSRIARCLPVANLGEYLVKFRINPWSKTAKNEVRSDDAVCRIRIANMGYLLGWEKTKMGSNEVHLNLSTMSSLLFGYQKENLQEVNRTVEEILELHTAFCQYYRIGGTDCKSHGVKVYVTISRRLLELAQCYFSQENYAAAWYLFVRACRLHWPSTIVKCVQLSLKLLMGPRLIKGIKYILKYE